MATGRTSGEALEGSSLQKISALLDARLKDLLIFGCTLLLIAAASFLLVLGFNTPPEAQRIFDGLKLLIWVIGPLYLIVRIRAMRKELARLQEIEREKLSDADWATGSDAINELYVELRRLTARSAVDPSLNPEVQSCLARLRALQGREAEKIRKRLDEGLHLKPGAGYQALEEARRLLAEHAHPAP